MSLGTVKFENILNPEEAFKEFKKYLIELYAEDYGEEYKELIKNRIDGTYYLFESNPIDTYNFYKENKNLSYGLKRRIRIEREYSDYISFKNKIDKYLTNKYKDIISSYFNTTSSLLSDDLLIADFDSFSYESIRVLNNPYASYENKSRILNRQKRYLDLCSQHNVRAITDSSIIERIINIRKELENEGFKLLLDNTIWGRRIVKDIYSKTGKMVDTKLLGTVMYDDKCCASVCQIPTYNGDFIRICLFPIMKNYDIGALDKIFYHENRHVIESDINVSGFACSNIGNYFLINELRTQENAIRDAYEFRRVPLFANYKESDNFINIYERLFDYCGPFIKNYLNLLNKIGINNDILGLENLFGKVNLQELEEYLKEVDKSFLDGYPDRIDFNKQKVLTYCLDSHFYSRHY